MAADTSAVRTRLAQAGSRRSKAETERTAASEALASAVRAATDAGMSKPEIAKAAGVSRQAVYELLRK